MQKVLKMEPNDHQENDKEKDVLLDIKKKLAEVLKMKAC